MTVSGQDSEEAILGSVALPPKPAHVSARRISLEAYGIQNASEFESSGPIEPDEFGLPLRTRTSTADSFARPTINDKVKTEPQDAEADQINKASMGLAIFGIRSHSANGREQGSRSTSLTRKIEDIRENGDCNLSTEYLDDENERGRSAGPRTRSRSAQRVAAARSRSMGDLGGSKSRPVSRSPNLRERASTNADKTKPKGHARTDTLTKIQESGTANSVAGISEWSHQIIAPREEEVIEEKEEEWQAMPALGEYDLYDDEGRLLAKGHRGDDGSDLDAGGAGKGYTRVQIDDDAKSATSMDENTSYLFKEKGTNVVDEDEDQRDPLAQMQATKDLLTEGQRIAYVGITRLSMINMLNDLEKMPSEKATKKEFANSTESLRMWSQKMMVRLYSHMDIDSAEQIMIEQLAEHGVRSTDLTPALMHSARVDNPVTENVDATSPSTSEYASARNSVDTDKLASPPLKDQTETPSEVKAPSDLPTTKQIDIDLRWTVLCDLFLMLVVDSVYDSRSRVLLEIVGDSLEVKWVDICRFEKRVTDALEMQEQAARENWDEAEHIESRRKRALKKKYMYMGLATVGGSIVIGLSAGLLAPVIGAGLAAGFTTIGVAGTSGFLAGAGGTALITSIGVSTGGAIAVKASHRRTGAVKTFEYRPLHNNKRVNLILTVSGWMSSKVDDVRLPFSTVDPIMGDIYSLHWEPDMLQSMGDTIRILATEALTQGLQQVLAATILTALMASLTLPIWLMKLSYLLDNPWSVSLDRSDAAGLILADSLIDRNLGARPITLVGFSLGARVVFACLKELASRGAYGLVQNVYLFGSPIVANKDEYCKVRTVIAGRFVNAYSTNDWILGYLFRATKGGIGRVAGLAAIDSVPGLENIDVTVFAAGHMAYRAAMPRLLRHVGWEVESDEFAEITDPDPDNHEGRQRQLIREIEDARKEAQAKPEKRRFGFFKRGKLAEKKSWEMYDEKMGDGGQQKTSATDGLSNAVLFDIDAIRKELESEHMEVKQLESTLPPMQITLDKGNSTRVSTSGDLSPKLNNDAHLSTSSSSEEKSKTDHILQEPFPTFLRPTKSFDTERSSAASATSHRSSRAGSVTTEKGVSPKLEQSQERRISNGTPPLQQETSASSYFLPWRRNSKSPTPSVVPASAPAPAPAPARPELKTATTVPVEKNAWMFQEDEQETWGKDGDVVMSFE